MFLSLFNIVVGSATILLVLFSLKMLFMRPAMYRFAPRLYDFLVLHKIKIGAVVTICAVLGSLYYSEIVGYEPCVLCWWQRIFIYSSALVLLVAWLKKRSDAFVYVVPLSLVGSIFAINQLLLIWVPGAGIACEATELCTKLYVNTFGFVSIPFMGFAVFLFLVSLSLMSKREN